MKIILLLLLSLTTLQAQDPRYLNPDDIPSYLPIIPGPESSDDHPIIVLLCLVIVFLLQLGACAWVHRDARKHNVPCFGSDYVDGKDPLMWAVLCLFFCPAWIFYLYRRISTVHFGDMEQTFGQPGISKPSRLRELQEMKAEGLITEAEFDELRRNILEQ